MFSQIEWFETALVSPDFDRGHNSDYLRTITVLVADETACTGERSYTSHLLAKTPRGRAPRWEGPYGLMSPPRYWAYLPKLSEGSPT